MFRFTIRDLLWLTVVVALGVTWWVDRSRLTQPKAHYEQAIILDGIVNPLESGEKIAVTRQSDGQTNVELIRPGEPKPIPILTMPPPRHPLPPNPSAPAKNLPTD